MKTSTLVEFIHRHRLDLFGAGVAACIALGLLFFFNTTIKPGRNRNACQSNLKRLGLAAMQYIRNYDEQMPMAHNWNDALLPYARVGGYSGTATYVSEFHCPSFTDAQYGYAYHQNVGRHSLAVFDKADRVILFFDSDANRRNAADNGSSLANPPRHINARNNICYLDGHVKAQKSVDFKDKWNNFRPAPLQNWKPPKVSTR